MTTRPLSSTRSAFTLVELMVVMTVIAILVGLLAAGVIPAMRRANEFAIQTENKNMERSIENFKLKYGFYPPSFKSIGSAPDMLPYLNRIAPNHAEGNGLPGSLLAEWWDNCGSQIGADGTDIVFWLSGLAKNKQFPVTGGRGFIANQSSRGVPSADQGWIAFPGPGFASLPPNDRTLYERENFYDFVSSQFVQVDVNRGRVRVYNQPKGKDGQYLYLDNANYNPVNGNDGAYTDGVGLFYNPKSFQLISAGMDGDLGVLNTPNFIGAVGPKGADNIVNFADGRLERIILESN